MCSEREEPEIDDKVVGVALVIVEIQQATEITATTQLIKHLHDLHSQINSQAHNCTAHTHTYHTVTRQINWASLLTDRLARLKRLPTVINPLKRSGVRRLHLKLFSAIQV